MLPAFDQPLVTPQSVQFHGAETPYQRCAALSNIEGLAASIRGNPQHHVSGESVLPEARRLVETLVPVEDSGCGGGVADAEAFEDVGKFEDDGGANGGGDAHVEEVEVGGLPASVGEVEVGGARLTEGRHFDGGGGFGAGDYTPGPVVAGVKAGVFGESPLHCQGFLAPFRSSLSLRMLRSAGIHPTLAPMVACWVGGVEEGKWLVVMGRWRRV